MTPLFVACQLGHLAVVEQLTAAKADVNIPMKVCYLLNNVHTLLDNITLLELNPLTTDDAVWRRQNLATCYQLAQSVFKIGSALAERVG